MVRLPVIAVSDGKEDREDLKTIVCLGWPKPLKEFEAEKRRSATKQNEII